MTSAKNPPVKLGYAEYALFPDDGKRHEIVAGCHYMNPAPSTYHQTLSKRVQHHLYTKIELAQLGLVFSAPFDVQLDEHTIVQPDLIVLVKDSRAQLTPNRVIGAPELLVEILSPSSAENDENLKRRVYQQSGVREYWIIRPTDRSIAQLVLRDGVYVERSSGDKMQLAILPQVEIPFAEIW